MGNFTLRVLYRLFSLFFLLKNCLLEGFGCEALSFSGGLVGLLQFGLEFCRQIGVFELRRLKLSRKFCLHRRRLFARRFDLRFVLNFEL